MTVRSLAQTSFFDPEFLMPGCLEEGSVPWLLARHRSLLFPRWLWEGWGTHRLGREAYPAPLLLTLLMLRWTETGMSRVASVRRATRDLVWRAALGLRLGGPTPDEKTVRRFERFMRERHAVSGARRYMLLHEHIVRLCLDKGVVDDSEQWVMDSTPMWCFGAVLDTMRLLGDGLRMLAHDWARATRTKLTEVARQWKVPHVTRPSTKGAFDVNWKDPDVRNDVVNALASAVLRCTKAVVSGLDAARPGLKKRLLRKCRQLLKVVTDDLETDGQGRLVVAERVRKDRLVSFTDPAARHGRKSKSKTFKGFKAHVLGDAVSGLIVSLAVTPGGDHDGSVATRMIRRAQSISSNITRFLGDTAYGGAQLRETLERAGNVLIAPPPPLDLKRETKFFRKHEFQVDFEAMTATCPAKITTADSTLRWSGSQKASTRRFQWPATTCQGCPLKEQCNERKRTGHVLELHPNEQTQRAARVAWEQPATRRAYRRRAEGERLVDRMTRRGGRKAFAWGIDMAHQQAHHIGTAANLKLLAEALAGQTTA